MPLDLSGVTGKIVRVSPAPIRLLVSASVGPLCWTLQLPSAIFFIPSPHQLAKSLGANRFYYVFPLSNE